MYRRRDNEKKKYFQIPACRRHGADDDIRRRAPERPEDSLSRERSGGSDDYIPPEDRKWYVLGALKAALLIALAFIVGLGIVIFVLLKLWGA